MWQAFHSSQPSRASCRSSSGHQQQVWEVLANTQNMQRSKWGYRFPSQRGWNSCWGERSDARMWAPGADCGGTGVPEPQAELGSHPRRPQDLLLLLPPWWRKPWHRTFSKERPSLENIALTTHVLGWEGAGRALDVWMAEGECLKGLTWVKCTFKKNWNWEWECWADFFDVTLTVSDLCNAFKGLPCKFPKDPCRMVTESAQQKSPNLKANPLEGGSLPPAEKQSLQRTSGRGSPRDQDVISNSGGEAPAFLWAAPQIPKRMGSC